MNGVVIMMVIILIKTFVVATRTKLIELIGIPGHRWDFGITPGPMTPRFVVISVKYGELAEGGITNQDIKVFGGQTLYGDDFEQMVIKGLLWTQRFLEMTIKTLLFAKPIIGESMTIQTLETLVTMSARKQCRKVGRLC